MAHRVCPVWVGYFLASPLRKLFHNPEKILATYLREGMTVLDVGSAMGFFSIPAARIVGEEGMVICVDMQEKMLNGLQRRVRQAGLDGRIQPHLCGQNSLRLEGFIGTIDFALAFAVVHEVPDPERLFREIAATLRIHGRLLVAEPRGHVKEAEFARTVALAERCGFRVVAQPDIRRSWAVLLEKA